MTHSKRFRNLLACAGLAAAFGLVASTARADDLGHTKVYKKSQLPGLRSISAEPADVSLVVEEVKPDDIKSIKTGSSNPDVKVRAVEMEGDVRIVITGDKPGDALVSWGYETKQGGEGGYANLMVHILAGRTGAGTKPVEDTTFEVVWGNELTFDGMYYYLNVNYQHRNEKQFACSPNACLVIPKAEVDYAHWKGWCWGLPGHPKKWQIRIKEDLSGTKPLKSLAKDNENKVRVVEFSESNQDFASDQ